MKNRGREKCLKIKNNFSGNEKREREYVREISKLYL